MLPTAGQREELPKIANCDDHDYFKGEVKRKKFIGSKFVSDPN